MKFLKKYSASQYIVRLLAALSFVLVLTLSNKTANFNDITYYDSINFSVFLLSVAALFALLYFIPYDKLIIGYFFINLTLYFVLAAHSSMDTWFSLGLCVVLCVAVYYFDIGSIPIQPPRLSLWIAIGALLAAYTLIIGLAGCYYYWDYWSPTYDFGIFTQMFYYMKETGEMLATCERDMLLSHFSVHFSPAYYLLLPVYCIFPTPETLLISCAAVVGSGMIPLVLLCRKYHLSVWCCLAFAVVFIFYPGFLGGQFYPIHENCFLVPLLLWFFYFVEKESTIPACIFTQLTMMVKEDAPVYIAIAALYFIISNKSRILNIFILPFSLIYFFIVTKYMQVYGEGIMDNTRYGDYIYDDGGLITVIKSLIQNPVFAIRQVFKTEKFLYSMLMLAPLCFLPLIIKKPAKLLLLIPFILINLMSNYPYQHDIGFQYNFGSGTFLMYLAVMNYSELGIKRSKALLCASLCSVIIFSGGLHSKLEYRKSHEEYQTTRETIDNALAQIPEDASVSASTFFVAKLSQRDIVYDLGYTNKQTEYVAVDLRVEGPEDVNDYLTSSYEILCYEDGIIAVFRNLNYNL